MDKVSFISFRKELKSEAKKRNIYSRQVKLSKFIKNIQSECDNSFYLWSNYGDIVVKCHEFCKVLDKINKDQFISLRLIVILFLRPCDFSYSPLNIDLSMLINIICNAIEAIPSRLDLQPDR